MLDKNVHDKGFFQKHVVCIKLYSILLCWLRTFMIKVIPETSRLKSIILYSILLCWLRTFMMKVIPETSRLY